MKLQRLGGYAAIASVCVFIPVVAFTILVLKRFGDLSDPMKAMIAYSAAPADFYVLGMLSIVFCILWLIVIFALHERMQANAPHLTRIALIAASAGTAVYITYFIIRTKGMGMIVPTHDISAYRALDAIAAGLQSMAYHAYGWACLLLGCAVLRTRAFSRIIGGLVLLAGILWIPITGLEFINMIPYWLIEVSFIWFGIALIRQKQPQPASKEMAASS